MRSYQHSGESLIKGAEGVRQEACQSLRQKDRAFYMHVLLFRGLMRISPFYIIFLKNVTIQNPIRKTVANATKFTHVVTSSYKLCQMSLRMQAFDDHIVIICMALNSYKKS